MILNSNPNNYPPITGSKRPRIDSSPNSPLPYVYDRFFKISRENGSFTETSPFLIHKALQATFGTLKDTRKMADGSLLIEVENEKQSDIASNLTKLHDFVVTSAAHKSLNVIKGVITCRDLQHCSDEEILENLKEQGVVEIYRIPQRKELNKPSFNFVLTFKLHQLPTRIHAGWYSIRVRPYFPPPMRCFACQRFGHTAAKCSFDPLCSSCGYNLHPDAQCSKSPKCVNCEEAHSPRYRGCTKYKIEFEIMKIKTIEKINYFEAKRKYSIQHPPQSTLFSTVTKGLRPKMVCASTQCDLTINTLLPPSSSSEPSKITSPTPPPLLPALPPSLPDPKKLPISKPQSTTHTHISKPILNRPPNPTPKIPQNKKQHQSRSARTTPNSSNESILDINLSDCLMDLDPNPTAKQNKKKK